MGIMQPCCVKTASMPLSLPASSPLQLPSGMRATRLVQVLLWLLPQQPAGGWTESLLEQALQREGITANKVTVYRALDRFVHAGVLRRHVDHQRTTRYVLHQAGNVPASPSWQVACGSCHQSLPLGTMPTAVQSALSGLQQALAQSTGAQAPSFHLQVQGACPQCDASAHTITTS